MFMISVLPQTEHLHRNANGLTAETQLQLVAGCFICSALLVGLGLDLPGAVDHDKASVEFFNRPRRWEATRGGIFSTLYWFDPPLRIANLAFERRLMIGASARTSIAASYAGSLSFRSPARYWKEKGHQSSGGQRH
jgi:hypothetical protein